MQFTCDFKDEPCVIDESLIFGAVISQGPKGYAGKLFKEQGIEYEKLACLRLEFQNIMKIENIWPLKGLTTLQLSKNIIETIENLDPLVNLKKLDLSFNRISKIQNLDQLVNLENLSLFENKISVLENLENLQKLKILSVGNNNLTDRTNVLYLRRLVHLRSLNLAGNPFSMDENFLKFIWAFLPKLVYYEYKMIQPEQRLNAVALFRNDLIKFEEEERGRISIEENIMEKKRQAAIDTNAFVENLSGEELYEDMFHNDSSGRTLLEIPDVFLENKEFKNRIENVTCHLHELALHELEIRKQEISDYELTVRERTADVSSKSRQLTEEFNKEKNYVFEKSRSSLYGRSTNDRRLSIEIKDLNEEFQNLCLRIWHGLMEKEFRLSEDLEKVSVMFQRNITQHINNFIEVAQAEFVKLRKLEDSFHEEVVSKAEKYFTTLALLAEENSDPYSELPLDLYALMNDQEVLANALSSSHDTHTFVIDCRENKLVSAARQWVQGFLDSEKNSRIERNRLRIMEINHIIDCHREEFQTLI